MKLLVKDYVEQPIMLNTTRLCNVKTFTYLHYKIKVMLYFNDMDLFTAMKIIIVITTSFVSTKHDRIPCQTACLSCYILYIEQI